MSNKVYEVIAESITNALDKGVVPWRKPWNAEQMTPRNMKGVPYRGINVWLLMLQGHGSPYWATYKQVNEAGGTIVAGAEGTPIVFWSRYEVEDENAGGEKTVKSIPVIRYYKVFNQSQIKGIEFPPLPTVGKSEFSPIEAAERVISSMPKRPDISDNGGAKAYYVPSQDSIHMPSKDTFESADGYYATLFHEMAHSTGHSSRLARKSVDEAAPFGSDIYAQEELVAEFASAFLCGETGISPSVIENAAAYIAGWKRAIKDDTRAVISAASKAQKAADYILGREDVVAKAA